MNDAEKTENQFTQEPAGHTQIEDALQENERHFRDVLETLTLIAVMLDSEGNISFCNDFLLDLTGWKREEVLGKSWFEIFLPPETRDQIKQSVLLKTIHTGELPVHHENTIITREGELRLVSWNNTILRDLQGNVIGMTSIGEDITERKRMEEALRESEIRLRHAMDNMLAGCQIIGFDWRYRYMNNAAAEQGRRGKEELLGRIMTEVYPGIEDEELFAVIKSCMEERTSHHTEGEFTFPDGAKGWFELRIQPVPEGVFILSVDITERRRAEQRARELAKERERIKILGNFMQTASQEFKTPLSTINARLHMLERVAEPEKRLAQSKVIREQITYIRDLG
jgi:PAS domain S-box-containing protein